MLIERKPVLDTMANAVLVRLKEMARGDVIETQEIEQLSGCEQYGEHWTSIIKKVKTWFLDETGILLWPVNGIGFKLCTVKEQLTYTTHARQRRAARQLSRSKQETIAIRDRDMDDRQRVYRTAMVETLDHQGQAVREGLAAQRRMGHQE